MCLKTTYMSTACKMCREVIDQAEQQVLSGVRTEQQMYSDWTYFSRGHLWPTNEACKGCAWSTDRGTAAPGLLILLFHWEYNRSTCGLQFYPARVSAMQAEWTKFGTQREKDQTKKERIKVQKRAYYSSRAYEQGPLYSEAAQSWHYNRTMSFPYSLVT